MFNLLSTRIGKLFTPLLLLGLCALVATRVGQLPAAWSTALIPAVPIALLTVALMLSIQFNRSRYSFLLLFAATGAGLVAYFPAASANLKSLLFLLLLINTGFFVFFKDRGLFSIHGLVKVLLLAAQAGLAWYVLRAHDAVLTTVFQYDIVPWPVGWHWLHLPDVLCVTGLVLCLSQLILLLVKNESSYSSFLLTLLVLLAMANGVPQTVVAGPWLWALLLSTVCLMVSLSILMDSYDMAYRDELTRIPSRRALNQKLLSLGRRYSIAMLDIDHFKKFNDTHGHDVGDQVLKMVATKLNKVTGGGSAYRYGGEEFTVVFPGKHPDQVLEHLEALRETIQNYEMAVRNQPRPKYGNPKSDKAKRGKDKQPHKTLSVTISIGVAERTAEQKTPEVVIKAADKALYRAKKKGRNRVCV